MKTILFIISLALIMAALTSKAFAQGVAISGDANATPHSSAILDVQSTEKGFLPPRMTTAERNFIANPANGLVVYDTSEESLFMYNGTGWLPLVTNSGNQWESDGGNIFRNTGNVGIGTDSPNQQLDVAGSIYATSSNWAIRGIKTGTGTFPGVWGETESTSINATGVRGYVLSTEPGSGSSGVHGRNFGTGLEGYGVRGTHDGIGYGVYGETVFGSGVYGKASSTFSQNFGVFGETGSTNGRAVFGWATANSGNGIGGLFVTNSNNSIGVSGVAQASSGTTYAVHGQSLSTSGIGVYGYASASSGTTYGVRGFVSSSSGFAAHFSGPSGSSNYFQRSVGIGTTSPGSFLLAVSGSAAKTGGGSWSSLSDERLKTVHGPYTKGLSQVLELQPVRFHYLSENPLSLYSDEEQIGFVAQQVQHIFPEAVETLDSGYLSFNMHAINVALVNAVKEQQQIINSQHEMIIDLMSRVSKIEQQSINESLKK